MKNRQGLFVDKNMQEGALLFTVGGLLLVYALRGQQMNPVVEWKLSPYLFPLLVAAALLMLGAAQLAQMLWQAKKVRQAPEVRHAPEVRQAPEVDQAPTVGEAQMVEAQKPAAGRRAAWHLPLLVLGLTVVYLIGMPYMHFVPASILYLVALLLALGERRPPALVLLPVLASGLLYLIFGWGLRVMLP